MTIRMHSLIVTALTAVICGSARSADPTPVELIDHYKRNLAPYETCAYEAKITSRLFGTLLPVGTVIEEQSLTVRHDGPRWRLLAKSLSRRISNGKLTAENRSFEWVKYAKGYVAVYGEGSESQEWGVVAKLGELTKGEGTTGKSRTISGLYGWSDMDGSLVDLVQNSNPTSRRDGSLWVVGGTGPYGTVSIWLDPDRDWTWTRVEQKKSPEDWYAENVKLGSVATAGGSYRPKSKYTGWKRTTAVEKFRTASVPTEMTVETEESFANGTSARFVDSVILSDIRFGSTAVPEESFKVSSPVPDGTSITVEDAPNIEYEWRGGKIVKSIDGSVVASLEGWQLTPEATHRQWWKIATWITAGLMTIAVVAYLLRRRSARLSGAAS